jgi:hypothetical protein
LFKADHEEYEDENSAESSLISIFPEFTAFKSRNFGISYISAKYR